MKRINVHLSQKQIDSLKNLSKDTGLPFAEHIRRIIDKFLEEKAAQEQLQRQAKK